MPRPPGRGMQRICPVIAERAWRGDTGYARDGRGGTGIRQKAWRHPGSPVLSGPGGEKLLQRNGADPDPP